MDYYETRWVRKDRQVRWIEVRATVVEDFEEPATLINVVDITERKKAEKVPLEPRHVAYVKIIKSNLHDIVSPFYREVSSKHSSLTPKQIQISNLIKEGKTTKEIAEILCVSKAAFDFHRDKMRRKLGLNKKKVNLRSFLSLHGC